MRTFSKKGLAILLVLAMALSVPAQTFAATNDSYIKDVKMVIASGATEAQARIGKDYKLLSTPIYEGKTNTYIAYQTTDDPSEAITDIRAMNMNGGWSYEKYKEYMDQQIRSVEGIVSDLEVAIAEFRINYENKRDSAIYAYKLLDQYFEDDTQKTLGRFMLEEALEDHDRLFTLVLECNTEVLCTMERALMIGCQETLEDTYSWRMSNIVPLEGAFSAAGNARYSAAAKMIISGLSELQETVYAYENSGLMYGVQSETEIIDGLAALNDKKKVADWGQGRVLYDLLKGSPYTGIDNEQTLYDLFMGHVTSLGPNDEIIADFSPNIFYTAAAGLSEGQIAMMKLVGLKDFLLMEPTNGTSYSDAVKVLDDLIAEGPMGEEISVYSGVDRSVFNVDGIAMTSETMQAIANDKEGAWAKKSERSSIKTGLIVGAAVSGGVGVLSSILTYVAVSQYIMEFITPNVTVTANILADGTIELGTDVAVGFWSNFGTAVANSSFAAAAFSVTIIAIAVLLIVSCILIILAAIEASEPGEWLVIPRKIMNDVTNSEGGHDYIYYDCVRQAHVDDNGNELGDGKFMDVGNWEDESHYRQWVAVYTTKDPKAGKPIYAKGFSVTTGSPNTGVGFLSLKKFNEIKAYNLNTYCSSAKVYLNYKVNTRYVPSTAASVFSQNTAFAFGGCGLLIGLAGGLLIGTKSRRRKQTNQ